MIKKVIIYLLLFSPLVTLGQVTSFNTRTGAVVLNSTDVTNAMGYTPANLALTSKKMTIAGIRALSGALPTNYFSTTDLGQEGEWYYDSGDILTNDNTGTVLVTSDGKRIKRIYSGYINVRWFGTKADGTTPDNTAIQNALNLAGPIFIPAGNYAIDPTHGLKVKSNTCLVLDKNAVLTTTPQSGASLYEVIQLDTVSNITIKGGTIVGDRLTHSGTLGEHGHGLAIFCSTNVIVNNMAVNNCAGDGIYVGASDTSSTISCKNLTFNNVSLDNNYRNDMSITFADGVFIADSYFTNANGTAPQAGIDLEPNAYSVIKQVVKNVTITNSFFTGNRIYGILLTKQSTCIIDNIHISNNSIINNGENGMYITGVTNSLFTDNFDSDNGWDSALNADVNIDNGSTDNVFQGNSVKAGTLNTNKIRYSFKLLAGSTKNYITSNDLEEGGTVADITDAGTNNIIIFNKDLANNTTVNNAILTPGSTSNTMTRPTVGATRITGEIAGYSKSGFALDDGFLRLSAGGGTNANVKPFIDLSGYSTVADMNDNIVLGTAGVERMRINGTGVVSLKNLTTAGIVTNTSAGVLGTTAIVPVANGGTGASTLTGLIKGNGTSAFTAAVSGTDYVRPLSASATLDFPSTAAQSSSEMTITVTGASDGDVVSVGVPNASSNANSCFTARVSATDTVTVKFNNYSSAAINPASGTFKVTVLK